MRLEGGVADAMLALGPFILRDDFFEIPQDEE